MWVFLIAYRPARKVKCLVQRYNPLTFLSTLHRQSGNRTGFVFLLFSVVFLSLVLQPCAIAAATSVNPSTNSVADARDDKFPSDTQQVSDNEDCLQAAVTNKFCCGTSAIHERSEASKPDSTHKNTIDQADSFTTNWVTLTMPDWILVVKRAGNNRSVEVLPSGPAINIRNCVYLI